MYDSVSRVFKDMAKRFGRRTYPAIPPVQDGVEESLTSVKEFVEIATRVKGDAMDSFLTVRDIVELGLIDINSGEVVLGDTTSGSSGGGSSVVDYAKRTDFIGDTVIYSGRAAVGALPSATAWSIMRTTIAADGDVVVEYADGNSGFDNIWDDRLTYTYS